MPDLEQSRLVRHLGYSGAMIATAVTQRTVSLAGCRTDRSFSVKGSPTLLVFDYYRSGTSIITVGV